MQRVADAILRLAESQTVAAQANLELQQVSLQYGMEQHERDRRDRMKAYHEARDEGASVMDAWTAIMGRGSEPDLPEMTEEEWLSDQLSSDEAALLSKMCHEAEAEYLSEKGRGAFHSYSEALVAGMNHCSPASPAEGHTTINLGGAHSLPADKGGLARELEKLDNEKKERIARAIKECSR